MKNGLTYDLYQVNWPLSYHKALKDLSPPDTLLMLKQTLGKYPIPAEAYEKHQNTLAFYMSSLKQRDY